MRDAFFSELLTLFRHNPKTVFLTGDLGYKLFDPLVTHDPGRVINCGIREAGMVGYAAGLAKAGLLPFVYSIVPFITLRCLEQIKIDLCYNRNTVVIVGVGGGFAYGPNASTHHGVDDIGALSCLPGLTIWTPADPHEVRGCVQAATRLAGPAYLRLGRNNEPAIHTTHGAWREIDRPIWFGTGHDGVIITCGFILHEVLKAAEVLRGKGIDAGVVQLPTIKPFPEDDLKAIIGSGKPILTIEEHIATGGLGQQTALLVATEGKGNRFATGTIPIRFPDTCMSREALLAWAGLDAAGIVPAFERLVSK